MPYLSITVHLWVPWGSLPQLPSSAFPCSVAHHREVEPCRQCFAGSMPPGFLLHDTNGRLADGSEEESSVFLTVLLVYLPHDSKSCPFHGCSLHWDHQHRSSPLTLQLQGGSSCLLLLVSEFPHHPSRSPMLQISSIQFPL